jgi:hypothetical protein
MMDLDTVSLRLGHLLEVEKIKNQPDATKQEMSFPLPKDVQNFSKVLKSVLTSAFELRK